MLHTFGSSYMARVSGNRKGCNLGVVFVVAAMELRPYPLWRKQTLHFFLCYGLTGKEAACEKMKLLKLSFLQVCVWCVGLCMRASAHVSECVHCFVLCILLQTLPEEDHLLKLKLGLSASFLLAAVQR